MAPSGGEALGAGGAAFALPIFALVFLQKFAVPVGGAGQVSLLLVGLYAWLAYMAARGALSISLPRLAWAAGLFALALASQLFARRPVSMLSLLQFLALYAPLVLVWKAPPPRYLALMELFQKAMLVGAAAVLLQLGWQLAFGLGRQPSLEDYVPARFLLQGYNYQAPIAWGRAFVRPNGVFFLEPSFASSFLASALVIELLIFRRLGRILVYAAGLLGTVAATGVLLALVAAPFLMARQSLKGALATLFAGLVGAGAAIWSGASNELAGRVSELQGPGSSGFERLVAPMLRLKEAWGDPMTVAVGVGAGGASEANVSLWPGVKVAIEYGALAGLLFLGFIAACLWRSVNRPLAIALFVVFNFTGGFLLTAPSVMQIFFLASLPALAAAREDGAAA